MNAYLSASALKSPLLTLLVLGWLANPLTATAQPVTAFTGAEGAGKWTVGGRAGRVIAVTHLRDSGPGSLRAAVEASGPRTVVFRVGGTIWLKSTLRVSHPFLTIAGQTAPGGGITVAGHEFRIQAGQVIVRYLRFRPGDVARRDVDAVSVAAGRHIILDHLSTSWGVDETLSVSADARDVTVQWCLISESLHDSVHSSRQPHGKGSLIRGRNGARISFYHNLYAHHADRAPMVQGVDSVTRDPQGVRLDFRNNVIYDWGSVEEGWEAAGANRNREAAAFSNFINNAYLTGPDTAPGVLPTLSFPFFALRYWAYEELSTHSRSRWAGNTFNGDFWRNSSGQLDPTFMVSIPRDVGSRYFLSSPVPFENTELPTFSATDARTRVLQGVGASHRRDAVDLRVLAQVRNGTGGLIDSQTEVGGWPAIANGTAPVDSDRDGLPDGWERARGLNPSSAADAARRTSNGRTWLERYLEELLDPTAVSLRVVTTGPGSASASQSGLPLGASSPLSITPAAGYIVERIEQNGVVLNPSNNLLETAALWADTELRITFARPRIPLSVEWARPYAAQIARHPTLNQNLGGMFHFVVAPGGGITGTLWNGKQYRITRGQVIAREQETPRLQLRWTVPNQEPLLLNLRFMPGGALQGELSQGTANAAIEGWSSPWLSLRQPLPAPQLGIHEGRLLAGDDNALLRLTSTAGGRANLLIKFSDGRSALRSTRLGPAGEWLMWSLERTGRTTTHGRGSLDPTGQLNGYVDRLTPEMLRYQIEQ